jgi:hypothetical protein
MTLTVEQSEQILTSLGRASDVVTAMVTTHKEALADFPEAEAVTVAAAAITEGNERVPVDAALILTTRLLVAAVHMLATGGA